MSPPAAGANPAISVRALGIGADWSAAILDCRAGPSDRPFEERHDDASISAVVSGTFVYRCDRGRALMHPGALLLGNPGACFECGHDHGVGDRCLSLNFGDLSTFNHRFRRAFGVSPRAFRAGWRG